MYYLNKDIIKALEFANYYHSGQTRKMTGVPFVTHPLHVANILIEESADNNLIVAGILHDLIEDTSCTILDLEQAFSSDVVSLVLFATDKDVIESNELNKTTNKKSSFRRKIDKIYKTKSANDREILLEFADKLSNLESLFQENKKFKDRLWCNFNCNKKKILLYYLEMYKIFKTRIPYAKKLWLFEYYIFDLLDTLDENFELEKKIR